jgi:hypothetical protein
MDAIAVAPATGWGAGADWARPQAPQKRSSGSRTALQPGQMTGGTGVPHPVQNRNPDRVCSPHAVQPVPPTASLLAPHGPDPSDAGSRPGTPRKDDRRPDVASRTLRDRLEGPLRTRLLGRIWCVTFVTVAELWQWAELRSWGPDRRAELDRWLSDVVVLPSEAEVSRTWA